LQPVREKQVIIRVSPEIKQKWQSFADSKGLNVSEAIRTAMNRLMEQPDSRMVNIPPELLNVVRDILAYQHTLKDELRDLHLRVKRGFDTLSGKTDTTTAGQLITAELSSQSLTEPTAPSYHIKERVVTLLDTEGPLSADSLLRKIFGTMLRDTLRELQREKEIVADAGRWKIRR